MSYDFSGKTVLITGGQGALGAAVARRFATEGANIIVADRTLPQEKYVQPGYDYQILNVLDEESVKAFFEKLSGLDVLANVVGGYAAGDPVRDLELSVLENQIELNLKSAFLLTKYALRKMDPQGGKIIHVGSRAAVDKGANSFAYSMSKAGVVRLVEAVAAETQGQSVNINCVLPSIMDTAANRAAMPKADHARWPKPESIAGVIAFLASPEAELINGAAIPVYGRA